ncbi:MAG: CoA-binding protein [Deltaproteobacteria bacterium]|nr:CoA-binding protein [Deltaproteobacteria bacterium]MBW1948549.1 CoA-binding protein [Deltaproteobacteria bacterium]MBW2006977.1 CoA-binding protein [Deltaproteobacteria bacterium]MBW2347568.1 CoA-binding protein [Deltaproteobacteria bacterium]
MKKRDSSAQPIATRQGSQPGTEEKKAQSASAGAISEEQWAAWESHPLYRLFFPRSVALVGVSGKMTYGAASFLQAMERFGYMERGDLYPVNPKYAGQMLHGYRCYESLSSLPQVPDYVLYGLPARKAPAFVEEAVTVGARFVVLFTSGFNETNREEGRALAREIRAILASDANRDEMGRRRLRVVGPNCLGIYNPAGGLAYFAGQSGEPGGRVSVISQSGGQGELLIEFFTQRGLPTRMCASVGNSLDIGVTEILDFYRVDPFTEAVACYVEGLREGEGTRFVRLVRETTRTKPVAIWKTGRIKEAVSAISSHTGVLAGDAEIFAAALRQAGAVQADSMESLYDATAALLLCPGACRDGHLRVGIVGSGGGFSVDVVDTLGAHGLERARFTETTLKALSSALPEINTFVINPVDMGERGYDPAVFARVLEICAMDENVDLLVVTRETERYPAFGTWFGIADIGALYAQSIADVAQKSGKPVFVIVTGVRTDLEAHRERRRFLEKLEAMGIPSFPTVGRAAGAAAALRAWSRAL